MVLNRKLLNVPQTREVFPHMQFAKLLNCTSFYEARFAGV